jgi:hypothetical protein
MRFRVDEAFVSPVACVGVSRILHIGAPFNYYTQHVIFLGVYCLVSLLSLAGLCVELISPHHYKFDSARETLRTTIFFNFPLPLHFPLRPGVYVVSRVPLPSDDECAHIFLSMSVPEVPYVRSSFPPFLPPFPFPITRISLTSTLYRPRLH